MKARTLIVLMALAAAPSLAPADTCQDAREDAVAYYNPRPFYYWGFIEGMWGGVFISMPLIMIGDTTAKAGLGYIAATQGACLSGTPILVAILKNPVPPYDVLGGVPKEQRTEYVRCYSARANSAQNKAALTGSILGTVTGAVLFGGLIWLILNTLE